MKHFGPLLAAALIFIACGTTNPLYLPVEADVQQATAKGKPTDLATLQKGYTLYQQHCSGCHALTPPPRKTMDQWNHILLKMFPKTKMTEQEKNLVQGYIEARR